MKTLIHTTIILTSLGLSACFSDNKHSDPKVDIDAALKNSSELESYLKKGLISDFHAQGNKGVPEADGADAAQPANASADGHSTTNTQEANVDEADQIKQNGDYLYAYAPRHFREPDTKAAINVYRTQTNPVRSERVKQLELPATNYAFNGMYLHDQSLVTLGQSGNFSIYSSSKEIAIDDVNGTSLPGPRVPQILAASLSFLNLDDPANPKQVHKLEIEGNIVSSRRHGDYLYLVNRFRPLIARSQQELDSENLWAQKVLDTPLTQLLPRYWVNGELKGRLFEDSGCYLPDLAEKGGNRTIISLIKINLKKPTEWQTKCSSGRINDVYASEQSLVLAANYYTDEGTRIDQFSLDNLTLKASGTVPGFLLWPNPSYRISEKDGYLQILTSSRRFDVLAEPVASVLSQQSSNSALALTAQDSPRPPWVGARHRLYVLKANDQQKFDQVAVIPNQQQPTIIGKPGEQIQSVRFRGDRAYIVTFRQTDPLYVLNLKDPANPFVEGELEIDGFSRYLHPLENNLLLGLGVNADKSGRTNGLKATLFDVSDPAKPTEITSQLFGERRAYAGYLNDPKAVSFLTRGDGADKVTRLAFTWRKANYPEPVKNNLRVMDVQHNNRTLSLVTNHVYGAGPDGKTKYERYSRAPLHADGLHLVSDGTVTSGPVSQFR